MLVLQAAVPAAAEPSVKALRLASHGEELRIDGRLDEPAWARAEPAAQLRQREPQEGASATEATEVRILYDARSLYVGVLARDREPSRLIARILQRDKVMQPGGFDGRHEFAGDDGVAILIDPFRDRRNAVVFATNPNGAEFDALITDEGPTFNSDWRGVWRVAAQRVDDGWSAEFEIPFRTLRYPQASEQAWGFNVVRMIRRKNEETLWTAWARDEGFHRVSRAGRLEGLMELPRSGRNLEVKPFALAGSTHEAGRDADRRGELGLDAKWEVRPGIVLDATVNSDFAQVEADDQQVNLTRFDLFFPEKREFFLENAGIFEFGTRGFGEPPPFLLFFSRRIGIKEEEDDEEGGEIPVLGGLRLSGRAGRQTIGFLDVMTGRALGEPRRNYGVLRVKRDVGRRNYVGAMLANRRGPGSESNTAGGVDASLWPLRSVNVTGFFARTSTSGPGGDDNAWRLAVDYTGSNGGVVAEHMVIGPEATAETGFITRNDIRRSVGFGRWTLRPRFAGLRKIDLFAGATYISRLDGEKQDFNAGPFVACEWNSGEFIGAFYADGSTRLDESFELSDRVRVDPGEYPFEFGGVVAGTSRNRPVVVTAQANQTRTYGGRISSGNATLGVSRGSHLAFTLSYTRNWVTLPNGGFTADLGSARITWAFSTRLIANALLQYNSLDRKVFANVRLSFIHRPGSDLFVVLNEERGGEHAPSTWRFANRGLAVKLTYLVRF
jgi:hypothetical protein